VDTCIFLHVEKAPLFAVVVPHANCTAKNLNLRLVALIILDFLVPVLHINSPYHTTMMQEIEYTLSASPEDLWGSTMVDAPSTWRHHDDIVDDGFLNLEEEHDDFDEVDTSMDLFMIEDDDDCEKPYPESTIISLDYPNIIMDFDQEETDCDDDNSLFDDMVMTPLPKPRPTLSLSSDLGIPRLISPMAEGGRKSPSDVQEQYMTTLQKLAASMQRSEMTRKELLRHQTADKQGHQRLLQSGAPESRIQLWSFIEAHGNSSISSTDSGVGMPALSCRS
jgi:hypothetical protein